MTTNLTRFKVEKGFESPGFVVDESGNTVVNHFKATTISTTTFAADNFLSNGSYLFVNGGDTLGPNVVNSSLQTLGSLTQITVNGVSTLQSNGSNILQIVDDRIYITSTQKGTIENVDIGTGSPGTVKATQVNIVAQGTTPGQLNAPNTNVNLNNTTISGVTSFATPPRSATAPSLGEHLTRKDYVDNSIVALAIALGV